MKNFKLLLATTAILSMGALMAHAVPVVDSENASADIANTTIHAEATLITSLTIEEAEVLNFGGIVNPQNGQIVQVTSAGLLGAETTAQVVKSSTGTTGTPTGIAAGEITISGTYLSDLTPGAQFSYMDKYYSITFPSKIILKSGNVTCGEVNSFEQGSTGSNVLNYGGKFTLANNIESNLTANSTMKCEGEGTVTLVYTYQAFND